MDDLIILSFIVWLTVALAGYIFNKWELHALDSLLGFYLALDTLASDFIIGLFLFGVNTWLIFEAINQA